MDVRNLAATRASKGSPQTFRGSQNGAGSGPGASQERNGRHRVDTGIYMLRSTSGGQIGAWNGSPNGPRSDIGLRLAPTPEKCSRRGPEGLPKWSQKCCKNLKLGSSTLPGARRTTSTSPVIACSGAPRGVPKQALKQYPEVREFAERTFVMIFATSSLPRYLHAPAHLLPLRGRPGMPPRSLWNAFGAPVAAAWAPPTVPRASGRALEGLPGVSKAACSQEK